MMSIFHATSTKWSGSNPKIQEDPQLNSYIVLALILSAVLVRSDDLLSKKNLYAYSNASKN